MNQNNIITCIITHNPNIEILSKSINVLNKNGFYIILIDNNSSKKNFLNLLQNVNVKIPLKNNVGLGKAYNICCKLAKRIRSEWILFLDQDSIPKEPFNISIIIKNLKQKPKLYNNTAIVSINNNTATKIIQINDSFYLAKYVIGSGMIVKTEICNKYKFLEELFLYGIDIEYSTRLRRAGYHILAYTDQMIEYKFGENIKKYKKLLSKLLVYIASKLIGKDITKYPYYSNPVRYYMMLRNIIYLIVRNKIEISYSKYLPFFILDLYENLSFKETLKYVFIALKYGIFGNLCEDNTRIIYTEKYL